MKITFLIGSAYGMGGTVRATLSLAARHEIEIITLHRWRDEPFFSIDDRVSVRTLMDLRTGARPGRSKRDWGGTAAGSSRVASGSGPTSHSAVTTDCGARCAGWTPMY